MRKMRKTILGLMILGLAPLFVKVHSYELLNTTKVVAYNLAESQIEQIKSTPFDSMGTQGGDPAGGFPLLATYSFNNSPGIWYYMYTEIRYKQDPSRSPNDPTTVDYKDITVEVKALPAPSATTGNVSAIDYKPLAFYPDITLNTRVAREGQWGEMPGGNIYVQGLNACYPSVPGTYVANMTVYMIGPQGPDSTTYQLLTDTTSGDSPGEVLFASLLPGTYTMIATDNTIPWDGYMVKPGIFPGQGGGDLSSETGQTTYLASYLGTNVTTLTANMTFQAAPACTLTLSFSHSLTNGNVTLDDGNGIVYSYNNVNGTQLTLPNPSYPNYLWPETYTLTVTGYSCSPSSIPLPQNNPFGIKLTP
jgi:hypothetical protein